mmetsp:Transcript_92652/g.276318  ORF Transcript_92652/g.276318 Transcript_92652/m.276318 type:complete len:257 (-) Transcript_92652:23-793(-)
MGKHTNSGLGGFMSGASIRFSKMKGGSGGADAWRDQLMFAKPKNGDRPRTTGTKLPDLNSVHKGTVVSIQPFGCFVQLGSGDEYKDGLLHISCISADERPERVEERLALNDTVWVKVTEVKQEDLKYSLDMRYLNQQDGTVCYDKGRDRPRFGSGAAHSSSARSVQSRLAAASPDRAEEEEDSKMDSRKRKLEPPPLAESSESSSEDSEERRKIRKKLEKAAKKLEKMRKKAEKVKKKLKKMNGKGGSSGSTSEAS